MMQQFVLIFRQRPHAFTDAELKTRADGIRVWAQAQNANGHKLEPRTLAAESHWLDTDGNSGSTPVTAEGPITALLFLEAADIDQATSIAQSHPALRAQVSVEIRPWSSPTAPR